MSNNLLWWSFTILVCIGAGWYPYPRSALPGTALLRALGARQGAAPAGLTVALGAF